MQVLGDRKRVKRLEESLDHVAEGFDEDVELVDGLCAQCVMLLRNFIVGGSFRLKQVSTGQLRTTIKADIMLKTCLVRSK